MALNDFFTTASDSRSKAKELSNKWRSSLRSKTTNLDASSVLDPDRVSNGTSSQLGNGLNLVSATQQGPKTVAGVAGSKGWGETALNLGAGILGAALGSGLSSGLSGIQSAGSAAGQAAFQEGKAAFNPIAFNSGTNFL